MTDWQGKTAAELGRGIGAGEIDPVELTEGYLSAISDDPLADRIYARTTAERARAEAKAAAKRAKAGQRRGPLDGVPVSWKDLFDSAGTETEAGTAMLSGRVPERDAKVLANATANGLICLGKTHMSEIAFSGLGYNPVTNTPPCVNDADAVPGGSSSGAAASVAFDLAPLAIGSDTGGSVRLPSAWNDLVGYKPTHGMLPLDGVVPLCASFDTVGPLARSVEDAALAVHAMGGASVDLRGGSLSGARLMVLTTVAMEDVQDAPARGFQSAVERLAAQGAEITDVAVPSLADAFQLTAPLYPGEAWAEWGPSVEDRGADMYERVFDRVSAGKTVTAADFLRARARLQALRRDFAGYSAGYDAIMLPSCPILPPKVDDIAQDADLYVSANLMALRNTRIGNLMGCCGVSLPTGTPSCGLMMLGLAGQDARLLRLAAAAEQALA